MSSYTKKIMTCPCCKTNFEARFIKGFFQNIPSDLDSNPHNPGIYDRYYMCPKCGYSSIDQKKSLNESEIAYVKSDAYQKIFENSSIDSVVKKLLLAASFTENFSDYYEAGNSYLMASWKLQELTIDDKDVRSKAISNFERYLANHADIKTALILCDCYRQCGRFSEALETVDSLRSYITDAFLMKIADYEKHLILLKDTNPHSCSEV